MGNSWNEEPFYVRRAEELPIEFVEQFIGNKLRKSEEEMQVFSDLIKENGLTHPVTLIVGRFDKRVYLGEGNHRLQAHKLLGLKTIPVMIALCKNAGDPISGYGSVVYPYLSDKIEDIDIETLRPSEVFAKYEIIGKRDGKNFVHLKKENL